MMLPLSALAQDADGNGTAYSVDGDPCDASAAGISYAPGAGISGMMLFEDQWPSQGDADFNDAVVTWNYAFRLNARGQVLGLTATMSLAAAGGIIANGLALHLPIQSKFVDFSGLPFVIVLPDLRPYPEEGARISQIYPDILAFAASGGMSNQNFFDPALANPLLAFLNGVSQVATPAIFQADTSCLPLIANVTHGLYGDPAGGGQRDGNNFPPTNLFDGDTNTKSRVRTGGSQGFAIEVTFSQPRSVSA